MEDHEYQRLVEDVSTWGLPHIKSTSKIQRTIMSVTQMSQDTTSIISNYYFPIDIDAVAIVAKKYPNQMWKIALLASELGGWPVMRIITKKFAHLINVNHVSKNYGYFGDRSVKYPTAQTIYNLACYKGYHHIAGLLKKLGATDESGMAFAVQGGCYDLVVKYTKKYKKPNALINFLFKSLCSKRYGKVKNDHIKLLRHFIRKNVDVTKAYLKLAQESTSEFPSEEIYDYYFQIDPRMLDYADPKVIRAAFIISCFQKNEEMIRHIYWNFEDVLENKKTNDMTKLSDLIYEQRFMDKFLVSALGIKKTSNISLIQSGFNMLCSDGDWNFVKIFSEKNVSYDEGMFFAARAGKIDLIHTMMKIVGQYKTNLHIVIAGACMGGQKDLVNHLCNIGGFITLKHISLAQISQQTNAFIKFLKDKRKVIQGDLPF